MAVKDPRNYAKDGTFQEKLAKEIVHYPQLGGVLLVRGSGSCCVIYLVRNPNAECPISCLDEMLLECALEGSYVPLELAVTNPLCLRL